jgi:uncharacterized membrane protein YheB (UPF0754 family)
MPDYKNGKIYKLWSPHGDEIYIGSTTQSLTRRKALHKQMKDNCCSKLLFEKYDDVRIELLEYVPCDNKEELSKREGEFIRNTNCINKRIEGRTQKERYEDNKEKILEQMKERYENNKEKRKEQMKEYYQENKEKRKEQNKEYYEKKVICECGCEVRTDYLSKHKRTTKHTNFINQ